MTWYAAHVIESIRPIKHREGPICVYENVILIEAADEVEALRRAVTYAKAAIVEDDTLRIDGEPAEQSFVGIRKIITVSNPSPLDQDKDRPVDGTEISYSQFEVPDESALAELAKGGSVAVEYLE